MTTTSAPGTQTPVQPAGFTDWIRTLLRRLFGATAPSAVRDGATARATAGTDDGEVVIAPGGFPIRKPQPTAASSSVDVESFDDLVPYVRDGLKLLPPLPTVVLELLKEIQNVSSTASSIASIAASDPSLAASLLRAVNNSAAGLQHKVTSISQAVSLLGFDAVRTMVIRFRLEALLPPRSEAAMVASEDIWTHSLVVAYIAAALASRVPDVDRGFVSTVGLLHDLGRLAICSQYPDFAAALRAANVNGQPMLGRETAAFGADHAAIGALLGNRWQLPADLNTAIRWHHSPATAFEPTDPPALRKAAFIVHIADQLAKYCFAYSEEMEIDLPAEGAFEALGLKGPLPQLLDAKVRAAATQALLFADTNSHRPLPLVRPFLELRRGEEATALARALDNKAPGVSVGSAGADLIEGNETTLTFDPKHPTPAEFANKPYGRFTAASTPEAAEWLAKSLPAHWLAAEAPARVVACARFVLRAILPNLLVTRDANIDIAWEWESPTLHVAFRSPAMAFAARLPSAADRGPQVLEAELANILNLGWFEAETSEDGTTLLLRSR